MSIRKHRIWRSRTSDVWWAVCGRCHEPFVASNGIKARLRLAAHLRGYHGLM